MQTIGLQTVRGVVYLGLKDRVFYAACFMGVEMISDCRIHFLVHEEDIKRSEGNISLGEYHTNCSAV